MDLKYKTKKQLNGMLLARANKCINCDLPGDTVCYFEDCSVYREVKEIKQARKDAS